MRTAERASGAGFLGSLADTPLAEVFQRIAQEGKSGDLQVTLPKAIKTVYFDRGFVVFASSNLKSDRLGESMIEAGRISRHEFALATMVMRSSKRKFGETLVEAGIVSEEELGQHVARQVNRIVLSLFSAKEGMYSFDERACTIPVELMVSLSVYRILLEGTRRMTSKKLVLAGLPSLQTRLAIVREPPFTLDVDKLRSVEKDVLRAARDGADVSEIVRKVGGDAGVALRAVYGLICAGVLEVTDTEARPRILRVQMETGSFVLSEIRRRVETRREAETEEETVEREEEVALPQPSAVEVDEPAVELEVVSETEVDEPVLALKEEPAPPPAAAPGGYEPQPRPVPIAPRPPAEHRAPSVRGEGLRSRLLALWRLLWDPIEAALLRWVGSSGEPPETLGTFTPRSRDSQPPAESRSPVAARAPGEDSAAAEQAVTDEVGVPAWSIVATPDPSESSEEEFAPPRLKAPSWSIKDDERDEESDAPTAPRAVGVPSWSVMDPTEEDVGDVSSEAPSESEAVAELAPLSELDSELFIEADAAEDEGSSMLSQIPVEEIAISPMGEEAVEIEFEVEEGPLGEVGESAPIDSAPVAFEVEEAKLEPSKGAGVPAVVESPPKPAPVEDEPSEESQEERAAVAREEAMRRMKQSGGEERLLRDVKLHFKLQDWEGAVPLLEQLVAISPGTALYRGMLARAMSKVPRLRKDAEEHFVEALRLAPQDPELHYWLGLYYKTFGLNSRAVTEFRTTLRIDPRHEGARKQLGAVPRDDSIGTVFKKIFG